MGKSTRYPGGMAIGMDLGDKRTFFHIRDKEGFYAEGSIKTTRGSVKRFLSDFGPSLVAFEVGTHSPWVKELAESLGHRTIVANPRRLRLISENDRKTDRADAKYLACLAQLNPDLLAPIHHRSRETRAAIMMLGIRDGLVQARTQLINACRGMVKPFGEKLPECSTDSFHKKALEEIPKELKPVLSPALGAIKELTERIKQMDRKLAKLVEKRYPEVAHLQQVPGVGPVTSTAFVLIVEDPYRFERSRRLGSYVGLVPKMDQSGDRNPQLGITKAGSPMLRRLLVQASHYILGPFGPDSDLRRFGLRLAERGGKNGKKKAVVATARKLAVVLHRLMITGEDYDPFYSSKRREKKGEGGGGLRKGGGKRRSRPSRKKTSA